METQVDYAQYHMCRNSTFVWYSKHSLLPYDLWTFALKMIVKKYFLTKII